MPTDVDILLRRVQVVGEQMLQRPHPRDIDTGQVCCGDESWRGRVCPYHQGMEDAVGTLLGLLDAD